MPVNAIKVKYKIAFPKNTKYSSYLYQKVFRALYGYTQEVYKSNGKKYIYYRPGVLFYSPYIRPEKNSVIVEQQDLQKIINFFETGINPCHKWQEKGSWKAYYYISEEHVPESKITEAIESLLERYFVKINKKNYMLLEIANNVENIKDKNIISVFLEEAKKLINRAWFNIALKNSEKAKKLKESYIKLQKQNYGL